MNAASLIPKLNQDRRLHGTCPNCGSDFRLRDGRLFSLSDEFPEQALEKIKNMKDELKERRKELADMKHRMTNRSQITAESVNIGKIVEKIAPSFAGFQFEPHDCRSLLEPIDYIIFTGLHERAVIESVTFLDVKSGGARLTPMQKAISSLIEQGRIEVETIVRDKEAQNGK